MEDHGRTPGNDQRIESDRVEPAGFDGVRKPDPEVSERPTRRRFTAEYKLRILQEADECSKPGEIGSLLRREGLYSSHLRT